MTDLPRFRSSGGRTLQVFGDPTLLTMDRIAEFSARIDADPRIASLSLVPVAHGRHGRWLRASGPAGPLVAVAVDVEDLAGDLTATTLDDWCLAASVHGLWHDWWLTSQPDVARAAAIIEPRDIDLSELSDPSGSHFSALVDQPLAAQGQLTVAVDVTWLGPHETGAQVLTTAAIAALARNSGVGGIRLFGQETLPAYASHLLQLPHVRLTSVDRAAGPDDRADIVWYPNQIDQRSNIASARRIGKRVVTTYLDLIAYDIPRYHGTSEGWRSYRALQRRIALSVDGITTISADVASRLLMEVPRLNASRVRPITLGLDHIGIEPGQIEPGEDLQGLSRRLVDTPFVLVLGNDFVHKNRDFAIRVWKSLPEGVGCDLVLAGLHVRGSSSKAAEQRLSEQGTVPGRMHSVGHVSSASRSWLLANAAVVLYPTSAEGFGLVPYEAARFGTPSTFTDFGPLREVSGAQGLPQHWTVDAYADDLAALLTNPAAREVRVAALQDAIRRQTWDGFAADLATFFTEVASGPMVSTSTVSSDAAAADSAALAAILSSRSWRMLQPLRSAMRKIRGR